MSKENYGNGHDRTIWGMILDGLIFDPADGGGDVAKMPEQRRTKYDLLDDRNLIDVYVHEKIRGFTEKVLFWRTPVQPDGNIIFEAAMATTDNGSHEQTSPQPQQNLNQG